MEKEKRKGWFPIDNEFIDKYAKKFGPTGMAIYICLKRHAREQRCFPSEKLIAVKLGITDRTVREHLKNLENHSVIRVERAIDPLTRKRKNNVYYLIDATEWKENPEENNSSGNPGESNNMSQRKIMQEIQGKDFPINKTKINKKTNIIKQILEMFRDVNPNWERLFDKDLEVNAIKRLLSNFGIESLEKMIAILDETNSTEFAPIITTPLQLEEKLGSLIAFGHRTGIIDEIINPEYEN